MFAICFFTDDLFQTGNGPQDQSTFVGSTVADKVDNIMDDIADAIVEQVDTIDMSDEKRPKHASICWRCSKLWPILIDGKRFNACIIRTCVYQNIEDVIPSFYGKCLPVNGFSDIAQYNICLFSHIPETWMLSSLCEINQFGTHS